MVTSSLCPTCFIKVESYVTKIRAREVASWRVSKVVGRTLEAVRRNSKIARRALKSDGKPRLGDGKKQGRIHSISCS